MTLARPRRLSTRGARRWAWLFASVVASVVPSAASGCRGTINDYVEEARLGDADSVREAVVHLGEFLRAKEVDRRPFDDADREAIAYLRQIVREAGEAQTRAGAIDALASLEAPGALEGDILLKALEDPSWVVQMEAARALALRPRKDAAPALAAKLRGEITLEAQIQVVKALRAAGGEEAISALLDAFLDPATKYTRTHLAIYRGLQTLSGKDYPVTDMESWRSYSSERKAALVDPGTPPTMPEPTPGPDPEKAPAKTPEDSLETNPAGSLKPGSAGTDGSTGT